MKKLAFFIFISLLFFSCEKDPTGPRYYSVAYEVTGTASNASLTYENASGGTSQSSNAPIPWEISFTRVEGSFVYLSAQNNGETGTVTVTIYKNDEVLQMSTSSGAYVIATASGSL